MAKDNEVWDIEGQLDVFDILAEAEAPKEEPQGEPQTFEDYIGRCEYCMWYGYGLYDWRGNRRKGTEGLNCQWETKGKGFACLGKSKWKPSTYTIPHLCGNCRHSNCFHYQKKPEYKDNDPRAFSDPVEEPNIYCTRDEGSVNRQQPFKDCYEKNFGACRWDRNHEWDTCEAWELDYTYHADLKEKK